TSGHATRSEQARMLDLVRPRCFVPVHGTLHHLKRHADLARERGVEDVCVVENGTSVLFDGTSLRVEGSVPCGRVSVGFGGAELGAHVLAERADVARCGLATVALALDRDGVLTRTPSIRTLGVAGIDPSVLRATTLDVARTVERVRKQRPS